MRRLFDAVLVAAVVLSLGSGCDQSESPGAQVSTDLDASQSGDFFAFPFPSDLRLSGDGTPDLSGYPIAARGDLLAPLVVAAERRRGFSTIPVVYFRFSESLGPRDHGVTIPARPESEILLIDIDQRSEDRGRLIDVVSETFFHDGVENSLLAIAPVPGLVLNANRKYAVVVTTEVRAADGVRILRDGQLAKMARQSSGPQQSGTASSLYQPMWQTLDRIGIARNRVAAATVFTTGDVVEDLAKLTELVRSEQHPTIENIAVDADDGASHSRFCELRATIRLPQYQVGEAPFTEGGNIDVTGASERGAEAVEVVITIPRTPMPVGGYPLMLYFHGSGGSPSQLVDRGKRTPGLAPPVGTGPAHVVAEHGIAAAASALPLSPGRLPGAADTEYINVANLAAFVGTFHQGAIEQRLLLDALLDLELAPDVLAPCALGIDPSGPPIRFNAGRVVASGQSMGGVYANMVGAVDPRIRALVPTGAGGLWHSMLLTTRAIDNPRELLAALLDTSPDRLSFLHPALGLLALAWEPAEPIAYMPRISSRPLAEHPSRPIYQPVGYNDEYFAPHIFDATVLAYGNQLAGDVLWSGTQRGLKLVGNDTVAPLPVHSNRKGPAGQPVTGVAVQYASDGLYDSHYIATQLDAVKYQYGCFFSSFLQTGTATLPAPAALGTPCPGL